MLKIGRTYQNMFEEVLDLGFAGNLLSTRRIRTLDLHETNHHLDLKEKMGLGLLQNGFKMGLGFKPWICR